MGHTWAGRGKQKEADRGALKTSMCPKMSRWPATAIAVLQSLKPPDQSQCQSEVSPPPSWPTLALCTGRASHGTTEPPGLGSAWVQPGSGPQKCPALGKTPGGPREQLGSGNPSRSWIRGPPGLAWPLSVTSFSPFSPPRPTRGLCPRLPRSPSEGRGLQVPAEAGPPLRNPPRRAGDHCVSFPSDRFIYSPGRRTRSHGRHEDAGQHARAHRPGGELARTLGEKRPPQREGTKPHSLPATALRPLLPHTAGLREVPEDVPRPG